MAEPKVSIIVRTCGRPEVLSRALKSIREQTYKNIEVVIIEDGKNISESFVKENFSDISIEYFCSGEKVGRCKVGNLGLEKATGEYFNFLDDDDYFLPDHVAALVEQLGASDCQAVYSISEEHQIKEAGRSGQYRVKRKLVRYKQPYNKLLLCYMNYIPIQSIMFSRSLFEQYGGFDEKLDVLEDWDLWVRYSAHCDFQFLPIITSVYHTPYKGKKKNKRSGDIHGAENHVIRKYEQYPVTTNVARINQDMDYILNVFNKKGILFYAKKIRNYLLYRDV